MNSAQARFDFFLSCSCISSWSRRKQSQASNLRGGVLVELDWIALQCDAVEEGSFCLFLNT